jgi:hypothetical protein
LRTVTTIEEVEHFQQLERLIWQSPPEDVVPVHVAITVIRNGGGLIAAFDEAGPPETGGMVGLTFWFPGFGVRPNEFQSPISNSNPNLLISLRPTPFAPPQNVQPHGRACCRRGRDAGWARASSWRSATQSWRKA